MEGVSHQEREGPEFGPQKSEMKSPRLPPAESLDFRV